MVGQVAGESPALPDPWPSGAGAANLADRTRLSRGGAELDRAGVRHGVSSESVDQVPTVTVKGRAGDLPVSDGRPDRHLEHSIRRAQVFPQD